MVVSPYRVRDGAWGASKAALISCSSMTMESFGVVVGVGFDGWMTKVSVIRNLRVDGR